MNETDAVDNNNMSRPEGEVRGRGHRGGTWSCSSPNSLTGRRSSHNSISLATSN